MKYSTLRDFYKNFRAYDEARRELEYMYNTYRSPRPEHYAPAANGPGTTDPVTQALHRIEHRREILEKMYSKILDDQAEVLDWLDEINASHEFRALVISHFLSGRSWQQVSYIVYRTRSKSTGATAFRRYIESHGITFDPE